MEEFSRRTGLFSTFGGNPVACAAGIAVLDVIERENLVENGRTTGEYLRAGLRKLMKKHSLIGDVRGHGMIDPVLLRRVLQNYVANAVRYTEKGRILIGVRRLGDGSRVEVHDTGIGIAPERQGDIFDEFYQIGNPERDRRRGLGLGLSIVRRIADLLGTPTGMRSREGSGSCFWIDRVAYAFDAVAARGGRTALTLYANFGCAEAGEEEPLAWVEHHLAPRVRDGVDYVLLSWWPDDCDAPPPDWPAVFEALGLLFPHASLGIGETDVGDVAFAAAQVAWCYAPGIEHPRFIGGCFWWDFRGDMVPAGLPLWQVLAAAMRAAP